MRVRWRGLELPTRVVRDESISTDSYGRFIIEPFERGFGTTVGNSLRRILLSSLEGAAVVRVKIAGARHEFTSLPGVLEDVTDIILNIKSLVVRLEADEPKTMYVETSSKGQVVADQIVADPAIEVLNRELVLATLTDDVPFRAEMTVARGRGYVTAEELAAEEQEVGVIPLDAIFSPVTRVRYRTEDTRVGQRTNYDRLLLEIWTDGTVSPEMALVEAAKILRKHLNPFVQYFELGEELAGEAVEAPAPGAELDAEMLRKLSMGISELELSVRASNCLESAKITTVGELAQMSEADLLKVRSFGKTSLREVKRKLADLGLSLGMDLSRYNLPRPSSRTEETAGVQ
ncbi:MAG: DNA-directed RNA polymerase subunit alpha [Phycisphaerae bacterium]